MAVGNIQYIEILDNKKLTPSKKKDVFISKLKKDPYFKFAADPTERYTIMTPETAAAIIASRQQAPAATTQDNVPAIVSETTPVAAKVEPAQSTTASTPVATKVEPIAVQPVTSVVSTTTPKTTIKTNTGSGKHVFKRDDIQVGNMQALLDEAAKYGIYFRITSGLRPGATTKQGKKSHHASGNAIDITPIEGQTYADLTTKIKSSPEFVRWMREHGYGIYDETTAEVMARTGASGAHWHIGPDRVAVAGLEKLLA